LGVPRQKKAGRAFRFHLFQGKKSLEKGFPLLPIVIGTNAQQLSIQK
jgi:hypothetical protein